MLPPYHGNSISCVGNGLDRSANLPIYWGRLPHSVREMSRSDRGRPPPSAGGTRKARDGGANHIKIYGRAWKPAPTNRAPSRRPLRSHCFLCVGNGQCPFRNSKQILRRGQASRPTLIPVFRSFQKHPYNPQYVILNAVKNLKQKTHGMQNSAQ